MFLVASLLESDQKMSRDLDHEGFDYDQVIGVNCENVIGFDRVLSTSKHFGNTELDICLSPLASLDLSSWTEGNTLFPWRRQKDASLRLLIGVAEPFR